MPQGNVFQSRQGIGAHQSRQTGQILGKYGIALVGHRRGSLLARRKILLRLPDLRSLKQPDFLGELIDGRSRNRQGAEEFRMAVALDDLGRDGGGIQSQPAADISLHLRIDKGEGPDGTRYLSRAHRFPGPNQALPVAGHLRIPERHFQAEGNGLRMNPVGTADHDGILVFIGLALQDLQKLLQVLDQDIRRLLQQHRQGGIQDIGGRHSHVDEPTVLAHLFRHGGEKGNDIVLGRFFDFVNSRNVKPCLILDIFKCCLGNQAQSRHRLTGKDFNIEPGLESVFRGPDGGHLLS